MKKKLLLILSMIMGSGFVSAGERPVQKQPWQLTVAERLAQAKKEREQRDAHNAQPVCPWRNPHIDPIRR